MQMTEADIMRQIFRALSKGTIRLFRNNSGKLRNENGQLISFGMGVGSSDIIGINMQSNGVGRLCAIEVKVPGGKPTQAQQDFIDMIIAMGGQAGVAHSVEEAVEILRQP
jgi:homoaconitase/3-isopropylmalate dehydratase large subunit